MTYEYGEPLVQSQGHQENIDRANGTPFARFSSDLRRHRVIACFNACAGISNEDLEIMGLGGVAQMLEELADLKHNYADAEMQIRQLHAMLNSGLGCSTLSDDAVLHAGPPLTAEQAAEWEWTGEQPRKLTRRESGLCVPRYDGERPWIMSACPTPESASIYWPLRRRPRPKADESPNPQPATLDDIAVLLQRILDRMPEREAE